MQTEFAAETVEIAQALSLPPGGRGTTEVVEGARATIG